MEPTVLQVKDRRKVGIFPSITSMRNKFQPEVLLNALSSFQAFPPLLLRWVQLTEPVFMWRTHFFGIRDWPKMLLATKGGWSLLPLLLAFWNPVLAGKDAAQVLTKNGELRGQTVMVPGAERKVCVFHGIPYAKPPVGKLRFSPPQPVEPWTGLRDAISYPPMCLQDPLLGQAASDMLSTTKEKVSLRISEDCLYLNVFTPVHPKQLPVMVWIHGGSLSLGAASTYDGSVLAAYENVVVVAIQYRLGILGFYSTGDEHARGNWGLLDQVAALQWVQENIAEFGGDPRSVTLFGESAGGFSSSAHILSPLSKGLFHRVISESGVATMDLLFRASPKNHAQKMAKLLSCPTSSSAKAVHCLREKTETEILTATLKVGLGGLNLHQEEEAIFIQAVVDGIFFPKSPKELLAEKHFQDVPFLLGVNNQEFGWLLPSIFRFPDFTKGFDRETVTLLLLWIEELTNIPPEYVAREYLQGVKDPIQLRDQVLDLLGDALIVAPSILTAKYHRGAGYPVYLYEFQHRPSSSKGLKPDFVKADHGDEIGFVFGKPFVTENATEEEKMLSKTVMKYWTHFARKGDPNGAGLVSWPTYDRQERYLEIDLELKESRKLKERATEFWTEARPGRRATQPGHSEL